MEIGKKIVKLLDKLNFKSKIYLYTGLINRDDLKDDVIYLEFIEKSLNIDMDNVLGFEIYNEEWLIILRKNIEESKVLDRQYLEKEYVLINEKGSEILYKMSMLSRFKEKTMYYSINAKSFKISSELEESPFYLECSISVIFSYNKKILIGQRNDYVDLINRKIEK